MFSRCLNGIVVFLLIPVTVFGFNLFNLQRSNDHKQKIQVTVPEIQVLMRWQSEGLTDDTVRPPNAVPRGTRLPKACPTRHRSS